MHPNYNNQHAIYLCLYNHFLIINLYRNSQYFEVKLCQPTSLKIFQEY